MSQSPIPTLIPEFQLFLNGLFVNREGSIVKIIRKIAPEESIYRHGFRYVDDRDRSYKPDGTFNAIALESQFDLIKRHSR